MMRPNVWVYIPYTHTYFNPASCATICAEDMPWELIP